MGEDTSRLGTHLRVALAALRRAQRDLAEADQHVTGERRRLAARGLKGIADHLALVTKRLATARELTDSAIKSVEIAQSQAGTIAEQPSITDIIAVLTQVADDAEEARATVRGLLYALVAVEKAVTTVLEGGSPDELLRLLRETRTLATQSHARLRAATDAAEQTIDEARQVGRVTGIDTTPAEAPSLGHLPPLSPPPTDPPQPVEITGRSSDLPAGVEQAARQLPNMGRKTVGRLLNESGDEMSSDPIVSGRYRARAGDIDPKEGLVERWHNDFTVDHAEQRAAAVLRRPRAPSKARLVLNRDPCDYDGRGCRWNLGDWLPSGTVLEVFVADSDGRVLRRYDFLGNGRGVRQ